MNILIDIYRDYELARTLGFKGWTACFFFYGLDRFSVDLDFDLLSEINRESLFAKIISIAKKYGNVKNEYIKANTIFLVLSYGDIDHNIKIEISTRWTKASYIPMLLGGITVLIMKKEDMFAHKLFAFLARKNMANRDIFDIHFFLRNNWSVNRELFSTLMKKDFEIALEDVRTSLISLWKSHNVLEWVGYLLSSDVQKASVKSRLVEETISLLRYLG